MDFAKQARYHEAMACIRLAELAESNGRPRLELAWLCSHALELICDLGVEGEALAAELDMSPSPDTSALYEELREASSASAQAPAARDSL